MHFCNSCNSELVFRLELKDSEDDKIKKLYLCSNCDKYYFIDDESNKLLSKLLGSISSIKNLK